MSARWFFAVVVAVGMTACNGTTDLELRGGVAVSFATRSPAIGLPSFARAVPAVLDDTLTSGSDTLIITSARLVLREIELKHVETPDCDTEPEPPGCEEIELGPVLVDLPLVVGAQQRFALEIPAGTYSRIDFEVHKVSGGDPDDAAFLATYPEFTDKSIRVQGSFNGAAFLFESDLDVEQELELAPPLTVSDTLPVNVTIRVNIDAWFRSPTGGLVDPATGNKGEANENVVKDNITNSIEAFEDADRDGDRRDEG